MQPARSGIFHARLTSLGQFFSPQLNRYYLWLNLVNFIGRGEYFPHTFTQELESSVMMAEKSLSLDDVPKIRHAFASCIEYLVEKTDFNVMYEELNNTDIGKQRMSHVFILKGGQSSQQNSQQLYDGIYKEKDNEFILWFDDIKSSLCRTANKNNGKHQKNSDILQSRLQDLLTTYPYVAG